MDIRVIGAPELVKSFGGDVRTVFKSARANWPFSTVQLVRGKVLPEDSAVASDSAISTFKIVVYGSVGSSAPTIPWEGQWRYENNWSIGVPIFDTRAEPIAELIDSRELYILVPLSENARGQKLMKMILADVVKIIMSADFPLKTAERLLLEKLPKEISTTIPKNFSAFCAGENVSQKDVSARFGEMAIGRYNLVIKENRRVMHERKLSRIAQSIEKLRKCDGVRRSFFCKGTLFVESTENPAFNNEVLRLYWYPNMQNACYEICGCVISVFEGKVFDLLSQGSIFEAFAELGRQVRHPYFEAFAVQDEGLNLSSIREDEQVRNNLLYLALHHNLWASCGSGKSPSW